MVGEIYKQTIIFALKVQVVMAGKIYKTNIYHKIDYLLVLPIRLFLVRKGVHSDLLILRGPTADESKMLVLDSFHQGSVLET